MGKNMMESDYNYFIIQLDLLVGFLDVSGEDVFEIIRHHDRSGEGYTIEQLYDDSYSNYRNHITSSALLLGFSHLEDFLVKCIAQLIIDTAKEKKYKISIDYFTIKEKGKYLQRYMADTYAKKITFQEKLQTIKSLVKVIDGALLNDLELVSKIRNCLMHNNGIADDKLAPKYKSGEKIILSADDINNYGWKARELANFLFDFISNCHRTKNL
jgi:hypothetical protein